MESKMPPEGQAAEINPAAIETATTQQAVTLLSSASEQKTESEPVEQQVDWKSSIPEKFLKDGELNQEAIVKSYLHLEKKQGAGDVRPESADKYVMTNRPDWVTDDEAKEVAAFAHEHGLSQKQFDAVMDKHHGMINELVKELVPTKEKAEAELIKAYGSKEELGKNLALAKKAFEAYSGGDIKIDDVGNSPAVIQLLARIGAGMKEDKPAQGANPSQVSVPELMASEAYNNPRHPQHQEIMDKISAAYRANPVSRFKK